jgi:hypothetical protein
MKNIKNKFQAGLVIVSLLMAKVAFAVELKNPSSDFFVGSLGGDGGFGSIILFMITKILLPLTGIVSVFFIILGGYQYMASGANEEMAESGKKTLQNAIIGLVIVILSYVIVNVVINALAKGVA